MSNWKINSSGKSICLLVFNLPKLREMAVNLLKSIFDVSLMEEAFDEKFPII
jgi:hypothetical protein